MITLPQIRAARGLLNWTQRELAHAAGISIRALNMIEQERSVPRQETLRALENALQSAGVAFCEEQGVRLVGERLQILKMEGLDAKELLVRDIIEQLRWRGGAVHYVGPYEDDFLKLNHKVLDTFYRDSWQYKLREQSIVERGFVDFVARPQSYRWLPREQLGELAFCVYHDSVALMTGARGNKIVITRNQGIAAHFMKQFKSLWGRAEVPPCLRYVKDCETGLWSMARAQEASAKVKALWKTGR